MMQHYEPLTDLQWQVLEPLFPRPLKATRGKPHTPWRLVVNSILLVLVMGVKWSALPKQPEFATKSAAHRWFTIWDKSGFLTELLNVFRSITTLASEIKLPARRNRSRTAKLAPLQPSSVT